MSAYNFSDMEPLSAPMTQQDLAWYRPPPEHLRLKDTRQTFTHACTVCCVKWQEIAPVPKHPRCFNCGRFVKRFDETGYYEETGYYVSPYWHPYAALVNRYSDDA